jgi:hypothetical protein
MFPSIFHSYVRAMCCNIAHLSGWPYFRNAEDETCSQFDFWGHDSGGNEFGNSIGIGCQGFLCRRHRATFLATGLLDACLSLGMMMCEWGDERAF